MPTKEDIPFNVSRYQTSELSNSREGTKVLVHDTTYCWTTIKVFRPSKGLPIKMVRIMAQGYCDNLNDAEETFERGLSETQAFVDDVAQATKEYA